MDATIATIETALRDRTDIVAVYLFGSVAAGTDRPDSDVDVGVLFDPAPPSTLSGRFAVQGLLEDAIRRPVDLVVLNDAPVDLRNRILRGRLVVERDRAKRIAFQVRTWNEWFDIERWLTMYRRPRSRPA